MSAFSCGQRQDIKDEGLRNIVEYLESKLDCRLEDYQISGSDGNRCDEIRATIQIQELLHVLEHTLKLDYQQTGEV